VAYEGIANIIGAIFAIVAGLNVVITSSDWDARVSGTVDSIIANGGRNGAVSAASRGSNTVVIGAQIVIIALDLSPLTSLLECVALTGINGADIAIIAVRVDLALVLRAAGPWLELALASTGAGIARTRPALFLTRLYDRGRAFEGNRGAANSSIAILLSALIGIARADDRALRAAATAIEFVRVAMVSGVAVGGRKALTALAETAARGGIAEGRLDGATNSSDDGRSLMLIAVFPPAIVVLIVSPLVVENVAEALLVDLANTQTNDDKVLVGSLGVSDDGIEVIEALKLGGAGSAVDVGVVRAVGDEDDDLEGFGATLLEELDRLLDGA